MTEKQVHTRSHLAMGLSILLPGLGHLYLRRPLDGFLFLFGTIFGAFLIYINSYPVTCWRDLTYIEGIEKWWQAQHTGEEMKVRMEPSRYSTGSLQRQRSALLVLYKFKNGGKITYRQTWVFKLSGLIHTLIFWLYAIYDARGGERGFSKRDLKR